MRIPFIALTMLALAMCVLPFWVQNLAVEVKDASGQPVPDMQVEVHYQKQNPASDSDGYDSGFTDEHGLYTAKLANIVQSNEKTQYTVTISSFYWEGESKTLNASSGKETSNTASFTYPSQLITYSINVIDSTAKPISGASIALTNLPVVTARTTGADGTATFRVPLATPISGSVNYAGNEKQFSSQSARPNKGAYEITVQFTDVNKNDSAPPPTPGGIKTYSLDLQVLDSQKNPVPGLSVSISPPSPPRSVKTDSQGRIRISNIPYSSLSVSFSYKSYYYEQEISLASQQQPIVLPALLKLFDPSIQKREGGCSQVNIKAQDLRPDANTQVIGVSDFEATPRPFEPVAENEYAAVFCPPSDAAISIVASNQFDTVNTTIRIRGIVAPLPTDIVPPVDEKKLEDEANMGKLLMLVQVLFLTIILACIFLFRRQLIYYLRCLAQYMRRLMGSK